MSTGKRKLMALAAAGAVAALTLSACGSGQPGAAALVGETAIADGELTREAEQVVDGLGIAPSNDVNRVLLQRLVLEELVNQLAEEHSIRISDGEVQTVFDRQAKASGGEDAFRASLLRNGVPAESVDDSIRMAAQLQQLGDKLAPGKSENEKQMAVSMAAVNLAGQKVIEINPRFGVWDLTSLQIAEPPNALSEPQLLPETGLLPTPMPQ